MKPNVPVLLAGLALLSAASVQASVDSILKLDLKCYYQKKTSTSDSKITGSAGSVRIDSKQLLKLLSKQAGVKYPGGSRLKVAVDGKVYVADKDGRVIGDVSNYFSAKLDTANAVFDGKIDLEEGEEKTRSWFPIKFTINLPSLKTTVDGVATEDFQAKDPDKFGVQELKGKTDAAVSGKGSYEAANAYFDGKLKLEGREAVVVN